MAAWRYEISLLVLQKYFMSEHSKRVKYFSTLKEKFRISVQPCNLLPAIRLAQSILKHKFPSEDKPLKKGL